MLNESILRQLANTSSYNRGEAYFHNDYVRRIKRKGNTFSAQIEGSELYDVTMILTPVVPEFTCSCPYDFDGICKHSVALGLAVLAEYGPKVQLQGAESVASSSVMDTDTLWQKTTTDQRMSFLRQLLDKQPDLRAQLMQFANLSAAVSLPTNRPTVDTISTEVFEALSDLRFDDDTLEFDDDDYYSEEGPNATPLIEAVFADYAKEASSALREGRLTDAFTICMGVYEGTQSATEVEEDAYGLIGDYPAETWAVWNTLMANEYALLANRVLHADQIRQALDALAERLQLFDETDEEHNELYYDLRTFEPLLLALVTDMPSARAVQQAFEHYQWQQRGTEYVQLRIADVLRDPDLWLQTADLFADRDSVIAGQLLDRRQQMGDLPVLLQLLHRFAKRFPNTFDEFVLQHLDDKQLVPGPDLNLYLNALENRCRRVGQLPDYLKLRDYWTESQRRTFASSLLPNQAGGYMAHPLFYAQVMHTEGRDAEVLTWFKNLNWQFTSSAPGILVLLAPIYPKECLTQVSGRTINLLETGKRDRGLYGTVASWLAALDTVPALKADVAGFVRQLHANYPRLSALKDELKQRGLKG